MKKTIILGAMLLSTVAFARGYNNQNEGNFQNSNAKSKQYANLSEEQITTLQTLKAEHMKESQEDLLKLEGIGIDIDKLLLEENVDWSTVNAKIQEAGEIEVALELEKLKNHEEIKEALGDDAPMLALGKRGERGRGDRDGKDMRENKKGKFSFFKGQGKDRDNDESRNGEKSRGSKFGFKRNSNLSDEQIAQLKEIKSENAEMRDKLRLEMDSVENEIQKLLIADDINWNVVETKLSEKNTYKNEMRLNSFKAAEEIEDITGKDMTGFAKRGKLGFAVGKNGNKQEWK